MAMFHFALDTPNMGERGEETTSLLWQQYQEGIKEENLFYKFSVDAERCIFLYAWKRWFKTFWLCGQSRHLISGFYIFNDIGHMKKITDSLY